MSNCRAKPVLATVRMLCTCYLIGLFCFCFIYGLDAKCKYLEEEIYQRYTTVYVDSVSGPPSPVISLATNQALAISCCNDSATEVVAMMI